MSVYDRNFPEVGDLLVLKKEYFEHSTHRYGLVIKTYRQDSCDVKWLGITDIKPYSNNYLSWFHIYKKKSDER